jgi:bifunctional non-homologous end joining protein LigD
VIASTDGTVHSLRSRSGLGFTDTYPDIGNPCGQPAVIDGEIVALDTDGKPSFSLLQRRSGFRTKRESESIAPLVVMVFDLLQLDGVDLRPAPLAERQALLRDLDLAPGWHLTDGLEEHGEALWATVVSMGLEGMVAKRLNSKYHSGVRSPDWRKIPVRNSVRCVVGGFTRGEGNRAGTFGSLLLGMNDGDDFVYVGSVGTGFDDAALTAIREALDQMKVDESPFGVSALIPDDAVFVEPMLVAHVSFREWTTENRLRHPTFKGFGGEDPREVRFEEERSG